MPPRTRERAGTRKQSTQPVRSLGDQAFLDAETFQQRGERRSGADAVVAFQTAAAKFREALAAGHAKGAQCWFGLAEALQMQAGALLELTRKLPDQELTPAREQEAAATAVALYQEAVQAYKQVGAAERDMQVDAAVNCANTLAALGELLGEQCAGTGVPALAEALQTYEVAVGLERDALTLSNAGDAQMQLAEALAACGRAAEGQAAAEGALRQYEAACALSDSQQGDDLPGLLHNWGVGLKTAAGLAEGREARLALLEAAMKRLQHSAGFNRGDTAPLTALGEVLVAAAELAGSPQEAVGAYQRALEEGFLLALNISRTDPDGLVGIAEVHAALGKLALQAGEPGPVASHLKQSCAAFKQALAAPQKLGSFRERCDVRYNYACSCALAGAHQEAAEQLRLLQACGALQAGDVEADEDLAPLRQQAWFWQLLLQLQQQAHG